MATTDYSLIGKKTVYIGQEEFSPELVGSDGLTKRELFAAMAMQGLLACPGEPSSLSIAELSVIHADALISELSKGTES